VLVGHGVDVVAASDKWAFGDDGDVLVDLEPHVLGASGRISRLASQAPYATAARTPSGVRVG